MFHFQSLSTTPPSLSLKEFFILQKQRSYHSHQHSEANPHFLLVVIFSSITMSNVTVQYTKCGRFPEKISYEFEAETKCQLVIKPAHVMEEDDTWIFEIEKNMFSKDKDQWIPVWHLSVCDEPDENPLKPHSQDRWEQYSNGTKGLGFTEGNSFGYVGFGQDSISVEIQGGSSAKLFTSEVERKAIAHTMSETTRLMEEFIRKVKSGKQENE